MKLLGKLHNSVSPVRLKGGWLLILLLSFDLAASAGEESDSQAESFETRIRPALIEHCLECHSSATEASGGLLLDSRAGWMAGGDLGAAIVPGDTSASLLVKAIEYNDPNLQMPPDGKLDDQTIDAFRSWVRSGAFDPREAGVDKTSHQTGLSVDQAQQHWAYRPLRKNAKPIAPSAGGALSEIDALINRRLIEAGLAASPPVNRRELARRLVFDLHGMPPSPETIETYLADRSVDADHRFVDRLLASPRFAEHFARKWMDVVRYAESITLRGFVLPEAWRYRDYLVASFAQDRPFDQMIRDQIAGDLLATDDLHETQQRAIATGFLALGNSNLEDQDKTKLEFDHIDEQLETLGRAFLAQTIGCARCHDHKFDPIPTRDYYALAAIMRSTTPLKHANLSNWIERPLPLDRNQESYYDKLESQIRAMSAELKTLESIDQDAPNRSASRVPVETLEGIVIDDADATFVGFWTESVFLKPHVGDGYRHDGSDGQGRKTATFEPPELASGNYEVRLSYTPHENRASNVRVKVFSANESATRVVNQRRRPPEQGLWISLGVFPFEQTGQAFVIVSNEDADGYVVADAVQFRRVDGDRVDGDRGGKSGTADSREPPDAQKMASRRKQLASELKRLQTRLELRPKYLTVAESEPRQEIAVRVRGNVHQLGQKVRRGFLSAIPPADRLANRIDPDSSGRVELAQWIADRENPLTARVYANRIWSLLMGDGLVASENNFGTTGEQPSHPELLDRLAIVLIDHRWSTKNLVRTIVTSDAYRRRVADDPQRIAVDPDNRLYASGNLKRIPVEALRDAMLCVSGELDRRVGGSLIRPGTKSDYDYEHGSSRRSVYLPVFRNSLPPLFDVFDFADASVSVGQRSRSTIAQQSLAMMNHPWVIDRAKIASQRFRNDHSIRDAESLVRRLHRMGLGRDPDPEEMRICVQYLERGGEHGESAAQWPPEEDRVVDLIQSLFASIDFRYLE
jgi:mono/diheme cytochrome c family protein